MKSILVSGVLAVACGLVLAKLPAPVLDDAAKAKAAETAARTAWQGKLDVYLLCKAQDKVAAYYMKTAGKPMPKDAKDAKPAMAAAVAKPAAAASAAAPAAAAASGTTPVATPPLPPCAEAGPFAYNPPEQKPLETSGAHSPTGTAASPPSVKKPSAEMAPATPGKKF